MLKSTCLYTNIKTSDTLEDLDLDHTTWLQLVCIKSGLGSEFAPNVFAKLDNMIRLDIIRCEFGESINDETFPGLRAGVANFTLVSSNPSFDNSWIQSASNFQHLDLSSNKLDVLSDGFFCGLDSLLSLNLSFHEIADFSDLGIQCPAGSSSSTCDICLRNLETLDISHGNFDGLGTKLSENLPSLKRFIASRLEIGDIEPHVFEGLEKLESIDLGWNLISDLPIEIFEGLPSLRHLSLPGNEFFSIAPEIFTPIPDLLSLDISANFISDLELFNETFQFLSGLTKIEHLDLTSNFFYTLSSDILRNKHYLKSLKMLYCDLGVIEEGVFLNAPNIKELNLGGNVLEDIEENTFSGLKNLRNLVLASNELITLHEHAFDQVTSLEFLYLFDNLLEEIPAALKVLVNLKHLYLSDNEIETLEPSVLRPLVNVEELYLDGNLLSTLPNDLFGPGNKLELLDISYNSLSNIPSQSFRYLDQLKYLWINTNFIKTIGKSLINLPSLLELDLAYNEIKELKAEIFPNSVVLVNISWNSISQISSEAFQGLKNIEDISLTQNNIAYFPPSWIRSEADTPPNVYLQGNSLHYCTCKSLSDNSPVTCENGNIRQYGQLLLFTEYLQRKDIVCDYKTDCSVADCNCCGDIDCNCFKICPPGCACSSNYDRSIDRVTCQGTYIDTIPLDLSSSVTHLDLSGTLITRLAAGSFQHYTMLKELYLNSSQITEIEPAAFRGLQNLELLSLEFNNIEALEPSMFAGLKSLNTVLLNGNKLTVMDLNSLDVDGANFEITLGSNPWLCNCEFGQKFQAWLQKRASRVRTIEDIYCDVVDLPGRELISPGEAVSQTNFSVCGKLPTDLFTDPITTTVSAKTSADGTRMNIVIGTVTAGILLIIVIIALVYLKMKISKTKKAKSHPKRTSSPPVFEKHMGRTWKSNTSTQYSNGGYEPENDRYNTLERSNCVQGLGYVPNIISPDKTIGD